MLAHQCRSFAAAGSMANVKDGKERKKNNELQTKDRRQQQANVDGC
jgi:hypothetical protein